MNLFVQFIYQPFFNLLVGFYDLLHLIPHNPYQDMGVAVILFTVTIRILMLPLTFASTRTRNERHEIEESLNEARHKYANSPEKLRQIVKAIFNSNRRVLISETINFIIQMIIFFILYRIFTTGLLGSDFHLLYSFMPKVQGGFDLFFLGRYDLAHPNLTLNIIQSVVIIAVEALNLYDSPFPVTRSDIIRYLISLPLASFIIFMFLPAGKKLFIITTLTFSFLYTLINMLVRQLQIFFSPVPSPKATESPS
jgi:membrane protein insertase Oxa1/YidC/SpoIIIJ